MIELIAKDQNEKYQYEGKCKLVLDSISRLLLIEPFYEEYKMISAIFKWKFVVEKNILFVFAEYDFQDFALIFDSERVCRKVFAMLLKKGATSGNSPLIQQRFLSPLFNKISKNSESSLKMNEILLDWIEKHKSDKKEEYIQLLKDNNIYDLFYPNGAEEKKRNLRKRKAKDMSYKRNGYDEKPEKISVLNADSSNTSKSKNHTMKKIRRCQKATFNKTIVKPNFEVVHYHNHITNVRKKRLILFTSNNRKQCYEYYWDNCEIVFKCISCAKKRKRTRAKIFKAKDGSEYVKLDENQHICEKREYKPEKYNSDPERFIIKKPNFEVYQYQKRLSLLCFSIQSSEISFIFKLDSLFLEILLNNGDRNLC